jgi:rubrerythrin
MEFKGSNAAEKNVLAAFAGESQARTRYSFFSSVAEKKDSNKYLQSSRKHRIMRRNMRN